MLLVLYVYTPLVAAVEPPAEDHESVSELPGTAHDTQTDSSTDPSIKQTTLPFSVLDRPQGYVASSINFLTRNMDEFFSNKTAVYESTGSYIRLTGDTVFTEGGEIGYISDAKARIALPNTQEKLRLVVESDPAESRDDIDRPLEDNPLDAAEERSYFAGLETLLGEFEYWRFRPGIGLKLSSGLDYFWRIRASRLFILGETWQAKLTDTLYWFNSSGYRNDSTLEFRRKIDDRLLFRARTFASRTEYNDDWDLSQVFSLSQSLSANRGLVYQFGIYGVSEPNVHATDYLLQIRYRKRLHSDYLFLELIPRVLYPQEFDFESQYSFTIRLEMVFKG